jgi:hypothetical protein
VRLYLLLLQLLLLLACNQALSLQDQQKHACEPSSMALQQHSQQPVLVP